jgi:hypothetical protein
MKGLVYLKKFAMLSNPEFFRTEEKLRMDFYRPTISDNIETVVEVADGASGTDFEGYIRNGKRFVYIKTDLESGVDIALKRVLATYDSVLIISLKIPHSKQACEEYGVYSCMENKLNVPKLACTLESLYKIKDTRAYDCVFIEEPDAILSLFSSSTLAGRQVLTYKTLNRILVGCRKALFTGVFMTQKSINFMNSYGTDILVVKHETVSQRKQAVEIDPNAFNDRLVDYIKEGGRPYVHWGCKKGLQVFLKHLRVTMADDLTLSPVYERLLTYKTDTDRKTFQSLDNINEKWDSASVVMAASNITGGNYYSKSAAETTFSSVWIYTSPLSKLVESFMGSKRVVNTTTGILYFCTPDEKVLELTSVATMQLFSMLKEFEGLEEEGAEGERVGASDSAMSVVREYEMVSVRVRIRIRIDFMYFLC